MRSARRVRKRSIYIFIAILSLFLLLTCRVTTISGVITVINHTATGATGLKIGMHYIGWVPKGTIRTSTFILEQANAKISCDNFDPTIGYDNSTWRDTFTGHIDLKYNYSYLIDLRYNTNRDKYYIDAMGEKFGIDETDRTSDGFVFKE